MVSKRENSGRNLIVKRLEWAGTQDKGKIVEDKESKVIEIDALTSLQSYYCVPARVKVEQLK